MSMQYLIPAYTSLVRYKVMHGYGQYVTERERLRKRYHASSIVYPADWFPFFAVEVSISPGNVTSQDLYSLREVATRWHSIQAAKPRLLLRVMRRSRLIHYARPSTRDKWPFQVGLGLAWWGCGWRESFDGLYICIFLPCVYFIVCCFFFFFFCCFFLSFSRG